MAVAAGAKLQDTVQAQLQDVVEHTHLRAAVQRIEMKRTVVDAALGDDGGRHQRRLERGDFTLCPTGARLERQVDARLLTTLEQLEGLACLRQRGCRQHDGEVPRHEHGLRAPARGQPGAVQQQGARERCAHGSTIWLDDDATGLWLQQRVMALPRLIAPVT